jgi:hypothetical protein
MNIVPEHSLILYGFEDIILKLTKLYKNDFLLLKYGVMKETWGQCYKYTAVISALKNPIISSYF